MNIFAKFHENIPNFSQEIGKNTENVPPPPKKTKLKIAPSKGKPPHKVFSYYSHQGIIKNICAKFHKTSKGSQEIEKKYHKTDQKIPQNGLQERRTYYEKTILCSKHCSNTKNIFTNLFETGFNSSQ